MYSLKLAHLIKERTGEDIIYQQLGYLMRSGSADSLDVVVKASSAAARSYSPSP